MTLNSSKDFVTLALSLFVLATPVFAERVGDLSETDSQRTKSSSVHVTQIDPSTGIEVQDCVLRFTEELNIPSTESGLVAELSVLVGDSVNVGDDLARLDDRSLKIRSRAAQLRLAAAQDQITDDLELRYAETARAEAIAELEASRSIYNESSGAIPLSNLRRLKLAVERAELEVARARKAIKQTQTEVDLRAADVALIDDTMRRMRITSPLSGVVLQVFKQRGEWIAAGDTVVRIARLDRVQAHALLSAERLPPRDCIGQPVTVSWSDPLSGQVHHLRGRVTTVHPLRLAGARYRITAEIVNAKVVGGDDWLLHPGTEVELLVYPANRGGNTTAGRTDANRLR